jgi:hypothetical protein
MQGLKAGNVIAKKEHPCSLPSIQHLNFIQELVKVI